MKTIKFNFAIIVVALSGIVVLIPLAGRAQQLLLNIGDARYPTGVSPQDYISDAGLFGYNNTGISLSDTVSTFSPNYGATGITTGTFAGGQTISLSYGVGAWAKAMPTPTPTQPDGLSDNYLYNNSAPSSPAEVKLGNLDLSASSAYTLYVFGWINGGNENAFLQALNDDANISYASTASTANGILVVNFTTSVSYSSAVDTLDFNWGNQTGNASNDSVLNGFAIVPVPEPSSLALAIVGGIMSLMVIRRKH